MKTLAVALFTCVTILTVHSTSAGADPAPTVPSAVDDLTQTDGFVGLTFPFGPQGVQPPHLTVGLRRTSVDSSGSVTGGELSLSIDPFDIGNSRLRVQAMAGDTSVQGSLGIGLVAGTREVFATGGVHGSNLRLLGDYHRADRSIDLFVEGNSLSRPVAPSAAASCPVPAAAINFLCRPN